MPITSRPSVSAFNTAINEAKQPSGRESTGKLTAPEMKRALKALPESASGVDAARDLMGSGVTMTDAATRALQGFIDKNAGASGGHGMGVRTFADAGELHSALRSNSAFAEDVFTSAFGASRSRSSSAEVTDVRETADGFQVDVELVHWQTRSLMKSATVAINEAGVIEGPATPAAPAAPASSPELQALRDKFADVGHARDMATRALADIGMGGLSRSDAVHLGDVTDGPMGTYFVDVNVTHFMDANDVRASLRLQLNHAGDFMGAADRPSASGPATPVPAPSRPTGVDAIADAFTDLGHARDMAARALADIGMGGLSRSHAVRLGDVSDGPMGTYFVDVIVTHFMDPNDVRAELRLQLDHAGDFMGAADRPSASGPATPAPAPSQPTGTDAIADAFKDVGHARDMATRALADIGMGGLSRSDAVHLGDVTDGPMGSYFVDVNVTHFMNANDVRAELRLQLNHAGDFVGASQR